ncbi:putative adipose-regulatory protein-domain-containing protein, partial [Morchella snyderi]
MDTLLATLLAPLRAASSKPARRAYITTFLLTTSATFLLLVAAATYVGFYMNYIPDLSHRHALHLQYSPNKHPTALLKLPPATTKPNQHYTITLHLHLPTTPSNLALGNFMTAITLHSPTNSALTTSRRPATLTHRTPLLETLDTLLRAPLYLSGLQAQSQRLAVTLVDGSFPHQIASAKVVLEADSVGVYGAELEFTAQLEGLRWWMWNRRVLTFLAATALFWGFEVGAMALVWWAFWAYLGGAAGKAEDGVGVEGEGAAAAAAAATAEGEEVYADDEETETEGEVKAEEEEGGREVSVDSGLGSMSESASSSRAWGADAGQRRR